VRQGTKRWLRRLALVAIAIPVAAWALEWAARQAEARGGRADQLGRWLHRGAELIGRYGRGPLASRLRPPPHPPQQPNPERSDAAGSAADADAGAPP
jgi:hypothetical protein